MKHDETDGGINFGHEFHGREHHFLLTRATLEKLAGQSNLDETAMITTYNAHLQQIHTVAERLSRTTDPLDRIVLEPSAFE